MMDLIHTNNACKTQCTMGSSHQVSIVIHKKDWALLQTMKHVATTGQFDVRNNYSNKFRS